MSIWHEINHLKILRKIENSDTPVHHKKIHFPTESLTIFEETMKSGEAGRIFESHLGVFYVNFLKSSKNLNHDLLDVNLWNGENFEELKRKIEKKAEKQNIENKKNKNDSNLFTYSREHSDCLKTFGERSKRLKKLEEYLKKKNP